LRKWDLCVRYSLRISYIIYNLHVCRLEQQHKNELDSYRDELNKWQFETDTLRQQLSENRVFLTKGNISLMKELQEKDDKIHELNLTYQQLQVHHNSLI